MNSYLKKYAGKMPKWLAEHKKGDKPDLDAVFDGRVLYYPGCGYDGQPIKTCNETHSVHVFIYADYGVTKEQLDVELHNHGFLGYHLYDRIELSLDDLAPYPWTLHDSRICKTNPFPVEPPFGILDIYEREPEYGEEHGSLRFAMIYICEDGYLAYDALFCNGNGRKAPFILMLQDHGFGGNYSRFGRDGLLDEVAGKTATYPQYIMCGETTRCWDNYLQVSSTSVPGGMWNFHRHLYKRDDEIHKWQYRLLRAMSLV